jgi:hypothetical protein
VFCLVRLSRDRLVHAAYSISIAHSSELFKAAHLEKGGYRAKALKVELPVKRTFATFSSRSFAIFAMTELP